MIEGFRRSLKQKFFSSISDTLLTLLGVGLVLAVAPPICRWLFFEANWRGQTRGACTSGGACWVFVKVHLGQFLCGFYPAGERWRVLTAFAVMAICPLIAGLGALLSTRTAHPLLRDQLSKRWQLLGFGSTIFGAVPLAAALLLGGFADLPRVETSQWGGLMLTLIISGVGCLGSLPLGILLALGRRSSSLVLRNVSIMFIELWRGVPLITVLFMASVMIPIFFPPDWRIDKLARCLIGVTLFSSAYMAEVVRGGMQGVAGGQYEAAQALGMTRFQLLSAVILPQALRLVIPGVVNTFIGLFKDTTLVLVIGLFDLLGIVQAASTHPDWLGYALEGYVFAGAVFWAGSFLMSRFSRRLEVSFGVHR